MKAATKKQRFNEVVTELQSLSDEYLSWREALPENLSESDLTDQLEETVDQLSDTHF